MIKFNISSFSDIKQELITFIKDNKERYKLLDSFSSSVSTVIIELIAGFLTYLNFKYIRYREESYLHTAKLQSSIYMLSRNFGYRINRNTAPTIKFEYNSDLSITISTGFVLGTVQLKGNTYDITYFGDTKKLVRGTIIVGYIGAYKSKTSDFKSFNFDEGTVMLYTDPSSDGVSQVDNKLIRIKINDKNVPISTHMEEFVLRNSIIDLTYVDDTAELWIYNLESNYGYVIEKQFNYLLEYIETPGFIDFDMNDLTNTALIQTVTTYGNTNYVGTSESVSSLFNSIRFNINTDLTPIEIMSNGSNKDSFDKIKATAPLLTVTAKRAVSYEDFSILSKAFSLFNDTYAYRNTKRCCSVIICYALKSDTQSELTNSEIGMFTEYFKDYQLLGTEVILQPGTRRDVNILFDVTYDCGLRLGSDTSTILEDMITDKIHEICESRNKKLGISFKTSEMILALDNVLYRNSKVVVSVDMRTILDGGSEQDITEETQFTASKCEFFNFTPTIRLRCKS
jgi:hypothetical protein